MATGTATVAAVEVISFVFVQKHSRKYLGGGGRWEKWAEEAGRWCITIGNWTKKSDRNAVYFFVFIYLLEVDWIWLKIIKIKILLFISRLMCFFSEKYNNIYIYCTVLNLYIIYIYKFHIFYALKGGYQANLSVVGVI